MTKKKIAGFALPHINKENKLRRVLDSVLKQRVNSSPLSPSPTPYWDAAHFSLEKVKIFTESSLESQGKILEICCHNLLEEAYFIEKAGVGYMAKMVSIAETVEERMLYALFSADEVTHLAQISCFLANPEIVGTNDPFLQLLEDIVESSDKNLLLFILQVVLEGWGLTHYRSLAKNCCNSELGKIFSSFLDDESRHHATGVTLFNEKSLTKSSQEAIIEILALFLQMVQVGPQHVVAAIEKVKGDLSRQQKVQIFAELETETHSGSRLNLLRSLMQSPNTGKIIQELDERGLFQPFPPSQCAF